MDRNWQLAMLESLHVWMEEWDGKHQQEAEELVKQQDEEYVSMKMKQQINGKKEEFNHEGEHKVFAQEDTTAKFGLKYQ